MHNMWFFLIVYFLYVVSAINRNFNYNIQIRNTGLRMIIFKEKKLPKILEKKLYQIYKPHNERLYKILGRKINSWEKYYNELNIE